MKIPLHTQGIRVGTSKVQHREGSSLGDSSNVEWSRDSSQGCARSRESVFGQSGGAVGVRRQERTARLPLATHSLVWGHSWHVSLVQDLPQCQTPGGAQEGGLLRGQ